MKFLSPFCSTFNEKDGNSRDLNISSFNSTKNEREEEREREREREEPLWKRDFKIKARQSVAERRKRLSRSRECLVDAKKTHERWSRDRFFVSFLRQNRPGTETGCVHGRFAFVSSEPPSVRRAFAILQTTTTCAHDPVVLCAARTVPRLLPPGILRSRDSIASVNRQ